MKKLICSFFIGYAIASLTGCGSSGGSAAPANYNPSIHGTVLITATSDTLQDANGKQLPGLLVSIGGTELYDVQEETVANYVCPSGSTPFDFNTQCGLKQYFLYYATTDCSGQAYLAGNYDGPEVSNVGYVVANNTSAYEASFSQSLVQFLSEQQVDGTCVTGAQYGFTTDTTENHPQPAYPVQPYSGAFPVYSSGPWTVVQ